MKIIRLQYSRYLNEVIQLLNSDVKYREALKNNYTEADIQVSICFKIKQKLNRFVFILKSGKIAKNLELVDANIRTKLDEIKRKEVDRLIALTRRRIKLNQSKILKILILYTFNIFGDFSKLNQIKFLKFYRSTSIWEVMYLM